MRQELMYLDGQWSESATRRWRPVEDPSTGEVLAEVPDGGPADADRAVAAARRAFDHGPWPRLSPAERRSWLLRLGEALAPRAANLVDLVTREAGCPVRLTEMMQVGVPLAHLSDFAEHALLLDQPRSHAVQHEPVFGQSEVRRVPVGVCVGFSPFNFPLVVAMWKLAPALAMGNTVVLKPSPLTPLASVELVRACDEVGFPPGVVNVVHGDREVGERLVAHPDVDKVSFTGSTAVARRILELAAGTIKRVTLELGGKSPSIILDDADLELAVRGSAFGAFLHAGQACGCTSRLLVPSSRYDEVLDLLADLVPAMRVGPATDVATDVGPLITSAQRQRVEHHVTQAAEGGAKVLAGGRRPAGLDEGHYFEPTVLVDVRNDMAVAREEVFGPVLAVLRYDREAEAVAMANDTVYGLTGAVWGGDLKRAREVASRIRAGTVWVNDFGVLSAANTPFGGFKQSGIGRELGPEGALEYTEVQHLYTALDQDPEARAYSLVGAEWD